MNDYTKGPWHCKPVSNGVFGADGYAITYPIVEAIAVLGSDYQSHLWITRNAEANARLIAAAPELLEALEEAVCALEVCGKDYRATEIARIAIAKAKGGTK